VSALNNDRSLKTQIGEGAELHLPIWHTGTCKALLMHMGLTLDTIKKQGHFKACKEAQELYVEQRKMAKQVKATLAELGAISKGAGKSSTKAKGATAMADATEPDLRANFVQDLKKAREAAENTKGKAESAAQDMFQFYTTLLSVDTKYAWNKIIIEQMQSNPYMGLQGVSQKGPRGPLCKSFDDCMMFHHLTVFPSNVAEQERYYITDVLKKPQRISVRQFVQHVEQLNFYIVQLPCFYYSPSVNSKTTPANVPFTEADLVSHILCMCPLTWQDHFNLHEKGMTPVDMHLLLTSLEAIEYVCTQEKSNKYPERKLPTRARKETNNLVLSLLPASQRKLTPRSIATSARSMGMCTLHTIQETVVSMKKTGWRKPISTPPRKVERNPIPQGKIAHS
jgi:hypothetical protein